MSSTTTANPSLTSTCASRKTGFFARGRYPAASLQAIPATGWPSPCLIMSWITTYTDDDKFIADSGWWEEHDRTERRLLLTLHGITAAKSYALIRTGANWLLHLTKEQPR